MAGIFISYRREDAAADAGRLFDDLQRRCLKDQVFLDLNIRAGQKFPELLSEELRDCDVLLALIGPRWLDLKDEDTGQRRLEDEQDFVRFEIASALAMHKLVVPVLLPGAKMPRPAELPESIRELAWLNAFEIRHNRWATDLNLLIQQLPRNLRCGEEVSMTLSWKSWVYLLLVPMMMLTLVHVFMVNLNFDPQFMLVGLSSILGIVHSIRFRFGWFERLLVGVVISVATGLLASVIVSVLWQQDILLQSWAEIRSFAAFVSGLLAGYLAGSLLVSIFLPRGSGSRNS